MDFFNKTEINTFGDIVGKPYVKNNTEHKDIVNSLKNGIWAKTFFWTEQVTSRLYGYSFACDKIWHQRGWSNGEHASVFKKYTWARIFKTKDQNKQIYFTVGVDGDDKALIYKLDYQFNDTKFLTEPQKDICKKLIKESPASWIEIGIDKVQDYSWEKLISETVAFIVKYDTFYDEVIQKVWTTKEKRVSRLTWNTNGWVLPSGPFGKSNSEDSHEAKYGYGHEEWLFDTSKIIDGFHYGFLEPIRKQQDTFANKAYDVWLYTIDSISKKRYWVGELKNVAVIDSDLAENIKQIYKANGWLTEMEEQIIASGANKSGFSDWKGIDLFNVRFKNDDIFINDPYFELPKSHPIYGQSRYAFIFYQNEFNAKPASNLAFAFISDINSGAITGAKPPEIKTFSRPPKSVEITYLHKAIQNTLVTYLREIYGHDNVTSEHPAFSGAKRVDIVIKDNDEKCIFVEIKTFNSVITSIREAIGQLLEYAFWPDNVNAKELIVVTQKPSDIQEVSTYFRHLRNSFHLPIYYQWFDLYNNELSTKV